MRGPLQPQQKRENKDMTRILLAGALIVFMTSCAGTTDYVIDLMPAPDVYDGGAIDPFTDRNPISMIPYSGILYATDRAPAGEEHRENFYRNKRGRALRLGVGQITLGKGDITWEEARRISLLKNRTDKYPIKITNVEEFGVLDRSINILSGSELLPAEPRAPAEAFAAAVNDKLSISKRKDIYIYTHGYMVVFENPLLIATELWHFLGYDGVFIAYAWPSTPSRWAYVADLETAVHSARNLRLLIEYLAEETEVERIHIIGYSAGTRVVINALAQLALQADHLDEQTTKHKYRMGHVILVGSDFDIDTFGGYLDDGLLKVPETLTIYMSETDKSLGLSKWLMKRQRLGQISAERQARPSVVDYLRRTEDLIIIDVTDAERASAGNGHAYFRQSPWVSSDVLMTLMYDLAPDERGVVPDSDLPLWVFPNDYIRRLRSKLTEVNPSFATGGHTSRGVGD
jgi:esterase/lipase superfamily enzyme